MWFKIVWAWLRKYIPFLKQHGWLPDPGALPGIIEDWFAKDKDATELFAIAPQLSIGDVDLRKYCTESNQYNLSSCVGNATADSIEILNAIAGLPSVQLSRLFVYNMARVLTGDLDKDAGTYIRSAFEALNKFGICLEKTWPYLVRLVFTNPSLRAQKQAGRHKIHSYYRIKSTGDQRVKDIITALRAHKPVVFGTLIDNAFSSAGEAALSPPTGATRGGHAMIVVGYVKGVFIIKNSWGQGWGVGGFCFMKPEYLKWDNTSDLWVPTLGTEFKRV